MTTDLAYSDIEAAARRIAGRTRPVVVIPADECATADHRVSFALEFLQHTGTFKARGALNFLEAHHGAGTLPDAGVTIASGGNAGLACAWAARARNTPATVFVPTTAPAVKVDRLRGFGARVEQVGTQYADAARACAEYADASGAVMSHAYDHPLIAAGAGTLTDEIRTLIPDVTTIVVAVGGGGLFSGVTVAARRHGIRVVAVEPEGTCALHAGVAAGEPVDVDTASVAADALGSRRASAMAVALAAGPDVTSLLVGDDRIIAARRALWAERRLAVEHAAGTAAAVLLEPRVYRPEPGEHVCVVLCGANTDPSDLTG